MTNETPEHQDPAEQYRTDRKVETHEQEDPTDELEHEKKSTEILHGADLGVHTDLPEN